MKRGFMVILFLVLFFSGCGYYKENSKVGTETIESDIGYIKIKNIPPVERTDPFVYVSSKELLPLDKYTALLYEFKVALDIPNRDIVRRKLSEIFCKAWRELRIFKKIYFVGSDRQNLDKAIQYADKKGADFFIFPELTYIFTSGSQGTTSLSFELKIYDRKGNLRWFIEHSGAIEYKPFKDYILFTVESRMPTSAEFVITYILAKDIGKILKVDRPKAPLPSVQK